MSDPWKNNMTPAVSYACRKGPSVGPVGEKVEGKARCAGATGSVALFPHNPKHAVGTCAKCGGEMIYNVPRLGPGGGYIHKTTMGFDCEGPQNDGNQP